MGTITADGVIALCYTVSATSADDSISGKAAEVLCLLGVIKDGESPWMLDKPRFHLLSILWDLGKAISRGEDTALWEKLVHQWFEENTL